MGYPYPGGDWGSAAPNLYGYSTGTNKQWRELAYIGHHTGEDLTHYERPDTSQFYANYTPTYKPPAHDYETTGTHDSIELIYPRVMAQKSDAAMQISNHWLAVYQTLEALGEQIQVNTDLTTLTWQSNGADVFRSRGPGATLKSIEDWKQAATVNASGLAYLSGQIDSRQSDMRALWNQYLAATSNFRSQVFQEADVSSVEELQALGKDARINSMYVSGLKAIEDEYAYRAQQIEAAMAADYTDVAGPKLAGGTAGVFEGPSDAVMTSAGQPPPPLPPSAPGAPGGGPVVPGVPAVAPPRAPSAAPPRPGAPSGAPPAPPKAPGAVPPAPGQAPTAPGAPPAPGVGPVAPGAGPTAPGSAPAPPGALPTAPSAPGAPSAPNAPGLAPNAPAAPGLLPAAMVPAAAPAAPGAFAGGLGVAPAAPAGASGLFPSRPAGLGTGPGGVIGPNTPGAPGAPGSPGVGARPPAMPPSGLTKVARPGQKLPSRPGGTRAPGAPGAPGTAEPESLGPGVRAPGRPGSPAMPPGAPGTRAPAVPGSNRGATPNRPGERDRRIGRSPGTPGQPGVMVPSGPGVGPGGIVHPATGSPSAPMPPTAGRPPASPSARRQADVGEPGAPPVLTSFDELALTPTDVAPTVLDGSRLGDTPVPPPVTPLAAGGGPLGTSAAPPVLNSRARPSTPGQRSSSRGSSRPASSAPRFGPESDFAPPAPSAAPILQAPAAPGPVDPGVALPPSLSGVRPAGVPAGRMPAPRAPSETATPSTARKRKRKEERRKPVTGPVADEAAWTVETPGGAVLDAEAEPTPSAPAPTRRRATGPG